MYPVKMARWLSWLERRPVTAEVVGSSPIRVAGNTVWRLRLQYADSVIVMLTIKLYEESLVILRKLIAKRFTSGILAQLGEHLPYKQRVIGSSPIGPIR